MSAREIEPEEMRPCEGYFWKSCRLGTVSINDGLEFAKEIQRQGMIERVAGSKLLQLLICLE